MIAASNLTLLRGGCAVLNALEFRLEQGELVALLGLNGAGKSTLLETLAGLLPGYQGECVLSGREIAQWPRGELSKRLSFLPQTTSYSHGLLVRQVVAMGRYPHSGGWAESPEDTDAIDAAMDECGCAQLASRRFGELSGGERQRVLLAAAIAQRTPILALDEPAAHADYPLQSRMFGLLEKKAKSGVLCIAAVHDLNLALAYATRALLLDRGGIAFDGRPAELVSSAVFERVFGSDLRVVRDADGSPFIAYRRRQGGA